MRSSRAASIRIFLFLFAAFGIGIGNSGARGEDIHPAGSWTSLASDRTARNLGDSLTVVIYEASTATNSAQGERRGSAQLSGQIADGASLDRSGRLTLNGSADTARQTERTGKMVAQISVVIVEVLRNGDLRVAGEQLLNVDGQRTRIKVRGRVRPEDISAGNAVLSTRMAEAQIDYDGSGFTKPRKGPGVIGRMLGRLRPGQ